MRTLILAGLAVSAAVAQSLTEPPELMRFHRRPGSASVRAYADAGAAVNVLGMASITGRPETWLMEIHDSFAGIEDADKSLRTAGPAGAPEGEDQPAADILAGARSVIGVFRPALSYRPEQATQALRSARYCQMSIYQVHPGSEQEFAEAVKSRRVLFDSINLDRPDIAYYVLSGTMAGTYIFLSPLSSLKVLDDAMAKTPAYAESVASDAIKTRGFSREYLLFRVEPANSWVSDEFASPDPEFWHPGSKKP